MRRFVTGLGTAVAARPLVVVIAVILTTMLMGGLAGQARELDNDQESYAPPSAELTASRDLQRRFGNQNEVLLQVMVTSRASLGDAGENVVSVDGLRTVLEVVGVVQDELGDVLVPASPQAPSVVHYLLPAMLGAQGQGVDPTQLDDDGLRRLQEAGLTRLPPAQQELFTRLAGGQDPLDATTGMILIRIDGSSYATADDPDKAKSADQFAFAQALEGVGEDVGLDALAFSFDLAQADDGSFVAEVARLFAITVVIVLLVLVVVLRARRGPILGRLGAFRRTATDVLLALGVVVLANVWVRGLQVALGPDGLGVVGPPSPPTNIVSILLIALGVDYAIHLQSRYREELALSGDPAVAVRRSAGTVGSAILLGALTTAVGFLTNLTSPLPPIADLGVLAAVGLVSAFLLTTTFLPAVRLLLDRRAARKGRLVIEEVAPTQSQFLPRMALALGGPALRNPFAVIVAASVFTGAAAGAIVNLSTEFEITAFLPEGSDLRRAFELIEDDFSGGLGEQTEVLVVGRDLATEAVHNAQIAAHDKLISSEAVVANDGELVGTNLSTVLRQAQVAASLPGADPGLARAVEEAQRSGLQPDATIAGDVAGVYRALAPTGLLDPVLDLAPEDPDDLPAARWVVATQSVRSGVDVVIRDFDGAFEDVEAAGADAVATATLIINDGAIGALRSSQIRGLVIAFVAVLLLLMLVYWRRLGSAVFGLLLMLPVASVAISTLGVMAVTGIPFDPVTATVSALVIGVGIDFTIHLGERFVEDLGEHDGDPVAALRASLQHTGSALAGSALTTVLGFAILITGSLVPFQRLGSTTVYAVALSLVAVVVVQPAILLLWIRRGGGGDDLARRARERFEVVEAVTWVEVGPGIDAGDVAEAGV